MKEVIILTIISGLAFLTFLVTLILGLTKKNKKLKLTALLAFIVFIGFAGWTGYEVISKTYNKVADTFKMRTSDEIYDALFDKRKTDICQVSKVLLNMSKQEASMWANCNSNYYKK
jgi:hypothetical protein